MLFANSNIDTAEEFDKRKVAAARLAEAEGVPFAVLPYDHEDWLAKVAAGHEKDPEKGARCERCFCYNLEKAAEFAREHGLDAFTTSLTVSPHKVSKMVFESGGKAAAGVDGVVFLKEDFKKREGFKVSVRRAAELGLYRQSYCGCEFSKREAAK
jgi:predicted adenine nucleotide alpha hydrolase (AANH) superfamily ATPase